MFILLSLALLCVAHAGTPKPPTQRTFNIQLNQLQLQIYATNQNSTHQDQYQFEIDLNQQNQYIFKANFMYHYQTASNQTQIQFQFQAKSVIEFNSTEFYQGNPSFLSQWPSGQSVQWHYWTNETKFVNNVPVYSYSSTTLDNHFTLRLHTSAINLKIPDQPTLNPNNIKLDFEIHDYPYTSSATRRLALSTVITGQSQSANSAQGAVNDNNLLFGTYGSDLPFGSFSWTNEALPIPSNNTVPVVAWTPNKSSSNDIDIYFTFLTDKQTKPKDIIWDPRIGLDYAISDVLCLGTLCGGGAIAVVVIIALAITSLIAVGVLCAVMKKRQRPYQVIQ